MAKFKVKFRQWTEELAEVEIEAETAEQAAVLAYTQERDGELELDWGDGNDSDDREVYEVADTEGKTVLEGWELEDAIEENA